MRTIPYEFSYLSDVWSSQLIMLKHSLKWIEFLTLRRSNLNKQIFNTDLKGYALFSCFIYF